MAKILYVVSVKSGVITESVVYTDIRRFAAISKFPPCQEQFPGEDIFLGCDLQVVYEQVMQMAFGNV